MIKNFQFDKELTLLVKGVKNAYKKIIKNAKKDVNDKGSRDLVTNLDLASEAFLLDIIKTNFPDDTIISEENNPSVTPKGRTWTVDPIDGTINFANDSKLWGLQISFSLDGNVQFGIIYIPCYNDLLYAAKGFGAYRNGKKLVINIDNSKLQLIDVDYAKNIIPYFVKNQDVLEKNTLRVRSLGAGCIGFYSVACSQMGSYLLACSNPWDLLPGEIICREAGATIYRGFADEELLTLATTDHKLAKALGFKKSNILK